MPATYTVSLNGVREAKSLRDVSIKLASIFKRPVEDVERMLRSGPCEIKQGLDENTAKKYKAVIESAGALVEIKDESFEIDLSIDDPVETARKIIADNVSKNKWTGTETPAIKSLPVSEDSATKPAKGWQNQNSNIIKISGGILALLVIVGALHLLRPTTRDVPFDSISATATTFEKSIPDSPIDTNTATKTLVAAIPSHWTKHESKDSFTDVITKEYGVPSRESRNYSLTVGCSKSGNLNFYIAFPEQRIPASMTEVNLRVDSDAPFQENWFVSYSLGNTRIKDPETLFKRIQGKSKLAVEIFAALKSTFDITGIEHVVADMQASVCKFEIPANAGPQAIAPTSPSTVSAATTETETTANGGMHSAAIQPSDGYLVQVGAFASESAAKAALDRIEANGLRGFTEKTKSGSGELIRVRTGPFITRDAAQQAIEKLKLSGLDAALIEKTISLSNSDSTSASQNIQCAGEYDQSTWTNCIGSRLLPNGDSYSGGYLNGKANGRGIYQFADGRKFVGEYTLGVRNGTGVEFKSDGSIASGGQWKQGTYVSAE